MGSVIKEIAIDAAAGIAWSAVRDVGNVHTRLVPGFVTETTLADGIRTVAFANGIVIREAIVTIDDERRRIAYASVGGQAKHHNASIEIVSEGDTACRLIWTTDILPDALASFILGNVEAALPIMKKTIEAQARDA